MIFGRLDRDLGRRDPNPPGLLGHGCLGCSQCALDLRLSHYRFASYVTRTDLMGRLQGARRRAARSPWRSWRFPQPYARAAAILWNELYTGGLEGQNDLGDRMTVGRLVGFCASDSVSVDAGFFRQLADRQIEQTSSRS